MSHWFSKCFGDKELGLVEYLRCAECGFVCSPKHYEMDDNDWEALNRRFHEACFAQDDNPYSRNQRHFHQALHLHLMNRYGVFAGKDWLDWGCGSGVVSDLLRQLFGLELGKYDAYMARPDYILKSDLEPRSYDLVLNTAVFEHVRDRETLDNIESFVHADGAFGVHTLVRGEVPQDPRWTYLLSVHCSFFTNRSMQLLMKQWGYGYSVYNEDSRLWVMFRSDLGRVEKQVKALNERVGWQYLKDKRGFMDYWP